MKIHNKVLFLLFLLIQIGCFAQTTPNRAHCTNPDFDKKVASWLSFSVPTITPDSLKQIQGATILDAREKQEYDISHIPNAIYIGYNIFEKKTLENMPKDKPIVVYCSIGYRSEKIGEKLRKMGFTKVYNLYGSIFEWVNRGNIVVDNQGKTTTKVHTFNRNWSKWVDNKAIEKVW